jgi:hypothetical protein
MSFFIWMLTLLSTLMYGMETLREMSGLYWRRIGKPFNPLQPASTIIPGIYSTIEADDFIRVDGLWLRDSKGTPHFVQGKKANLDGLHMMARDDILTWLLPFPLWKRQV